MLSIGRSEGRAMVVVQMSERELTRLRVMIDFVDSDMYVHQE